MLVFYFVSNLLQGGRQSPSDAVWGQLLRLISILPEWLQALSAMVPITYSLEAMRYALFNPEEVGTVLGDLAFLATFALFALPMSVWVFVRAVHQAKITRSLGCH